MQSNLLDLDQMMKMILDAFEVKLQKRMGEHPMNNTILMNIWEGGLNKDAFQFFNARERKLEKLLISIEEYKRIEAKRCGTLYFHN